MVIYSYNWFSTSTATVGSITYPGYYYPTYPSYSPSPTCVVSRKVSHALTSPRSTRIPKLDVRLINYPANRDYSVWMKDGRSAYTTWYDVAVFNSAAGGIFMPRSISRRR